MHLLVIGGGGYIGSHMVRYLIERECRVTVLDNLSTGHADAVWEGAELIVGDIRNRDLLQDIFQSNHYDGVFHFAATSQVAESVRNPRKYYDNNVLGSLTLFDALIVNGIDKLVFSSSAAVYGEPQAALLTEAHPRQPVNAYGRTKLAVEGILDDYRRAHGLEAVSLRYFNAAGAHPDGLLAERHDPETHLIPNILKAAMTGGTVRIFGADYATPDGTCIRDYVHVQDLCEAHWLALKQLFNQGGNQTFNLGYGRGFSVKEVVSTVEAVTGRQLDVVSVERRPGDPATLVADPRKARRVLNWVPQYADLTKIIRDALNATYRSA